MGISELQPGQSVTWIYIPRGGYCMPYPVPSMVLVVKRSRIGIAALLKTGEWVPRWVKPGSLRPA